MNTPPFAVLLPAAGSGNRFCAGDKLLADLAGRSVLQRSALLFAHRPDVALVLIVTTPDRFQPYEEHLQPVLPPGTRLLFTAGGSERWESVLFGLRHLGTLRLVSPPTHIAIHDAARPLTPAHVIDRAFQTALQKNAALPAIPEPATLKKSNPDGTIHSTIDRRNLYQAQTPQCFHLQTLLAAYEKLLIANQLQDATDDAQIFERANLPVPITPGDPLNLKITTLADLALARAILATQSPNPSDK